MNLSSFKLGVYDFLGLVVPGMFLICEGWIAVRGWPQFAETLSALRPVSFTVFLAGSFVLGHFVQEVADWGMKRIRGPRFFKKGRDEVWDGADGETVKSAIWAESGLTLASVDSAFDYCLTRIGEAFSKRDVFVATSDFARSFIVLSVCGIAPAWHWIGLIRFPPSFCFSVPTSYCLCSLRSSLGGAWFGLGICLTAGCSEHI